MLLSCGGGQTDTQRLCRRATYTWKRDEAGTGAAARAHEETLLVSSHLYFAETQAKH